MAKSHFTSDAVPGGKRGIVVAFPRSNSKASRVLEIGAAPALVLPIDNPTDDAAVLERIAPWMREELDCFEMWRSSLFISRLGRTIDQNMGAPTMARVQWKIKYGTNIGGKFSTPAGNVLMRMISCFSGSYANFEAHRDALLISKLAQPHWLRTGPRGTRPNEFDTVIFGAERHIKIRRNGDRYEMNIALTDEEHDEVKSQRSREFEEAQSGVQREIDKLPRTVGTYMEIFLGVADLQARAMQMLACESRGGFALDDPSRAAILTQLDSLRQAIYRAKAKFDRGERRSEIACIVQKHAPSNANISGART